MSQAEFISPRGSSVAFRCRVPDRRMIGAVCSPSPGPNTHLAARYGRRRWKKYRDYFQIPLNPRQRTLNPAPTDPTVFVLVFLDRFHVAAQPAPVKPSLVDAPYVDV